MRKSVCCFLAAVASVGTGAESDVFYSMAMKPAVADALEEKFISGVSDADAAQEKLESLIRGRTVTSLDKLLFDATVPDRQWLRDQTKAKQIEVMPGWAELEGGEMSCLYGKGQVLDLFAKHASAEKKVINLKELKTKAPAANGHFVYGRWDNPDEESQIFLSRSPGASTDSLMLVKVQQLRFRTEKERDDFATKVEAATPDQKEKAALFLESKTELVQGISVISAKDQETRLSNRTPVAYEISDDIYEHRDGGLRFELSYETRDDDQILSVFYLHTGLTGKKKDHDTGEKIPEFFSGLYTDKLDFAKNSTVIVPLYHTHSAGADVLLIRLIHFE